MLEMTPSLCLSSRMDGGTLSQGRQVWEREYESVCHDQKKIHLHPSHQSQSLGVYRLWKYCRHTCLCPPSLYAETLTPVDGIRRGAFGR